MAKGYPSARKVSLVLTQVEARGELEQSFFDEVREEVETGPGVGGRQQPLRVERPDRCHRGRFERRARRIGIELRRRPDARIDPARKFRDTRQPPPHTPPPTPVPPPPPPLTHPPHPP